MRKLLLGLTISVYVTAGSPSSPTSPAPLNHPLKASQVACASRQLGRVQLRMAAFGGWINRYSDIDFLAPDPGGSILALSHTSLGGGIFSGLVRMIDLGPSPCSDFQEGLTHFAQADLAFDLLFKQRTGLLDPGHPRIPQATLVRRDWGTSLKADYADCYTSHVVQPVLSCPLVLSLDLAAQAKDQLIPQSPIYLNGARDEAPDLDGLGARPLASATGRGPGILNDDLSEACGGTLTDFDQGLFEILARTILPSNVFTVLAPGSCDGVPQPEGFALGIFRGADPHVYRVDVYGYSSTPDDSGQIFGNGLGMAIEFKMNWDRSGRLTTGTARVLPPCRAGQDLDCTRALGGLALFIVPPIFPGHEEEPSSAFHNAPYLNFTGSADSPANVLTTTIDWVDLLKNTALNSP